MADKPHYKAQQVIDAIQGTGGVYAVIARRLGCHRDTVVNYIERYATVKRAYENEKHNVDDKARSNVLQAINDGDVDVSKWWLRVKMPDEFAPAERREVSGPDGGAIKVKGYAVVSPDDWDA